MNFIHSFHWVIQNNFCYAEGSQQKECMSPWLFYFLARTASELVPNKLAFQTDAVFTQNSSINWLLSINMQCLALKCFTKFVQLVITHSFKALLVSFHSGLCFPANCFFRAWAVLSSIFEKRGQGCKKKKTITSRFIVPFKYSSEFLKGIGSSRGFRAQNWFDACCNNASSEWLRHTPISIFSSIFASPFVLWATIEDKEYVLT